MQLPIDFLLCGQAGWSPKSLKTARLGAGWRPSAPVGNLRFPFAVYLYAKRGDQTLHSGSRRGVLREGEIVEVSAWTRFHYDGPVAAASRARGNPCLEIETGASLLPPHGREATLTLQLAREVFADPSADWSAACAAQRAGLPPGRLRAGLFREGSALTAIVREQRLMRALVSVSAVQETRIDLSLLASWTGFGSQARFEAAFFQQFGCCPTAMGSLAAGAALAHKALPPDARCTTPRDAA